MFRPDTVQYLQRRAPEASLILADLRLGEGDQEIAIIYGGALDEQCNVDFDLATGRQVVTWLGQMLTQEHDKFHVEDAELREPWTVMWSDSDGTTLFRVEGK